MIAILLAGCAGSTNVQSGSVGVHVQSGPVAGALIGLGIAAAATQGTAATQGAPAPQLDATRKVREQDCTKPMEEWSANLRCR